MNIRFVLKILGWVLLILGGFMCSNIIWALVYDEPTLWGHLAASLITLAVGAAFFWNARGNIQSGLNLKESYLTVTFTWLTISLFGTLPYMLTGSIPDFVDAFFETSSGFTTTGASILTDIEAMPRSILFWRSLTHWIGGMGIIVLVVAILPMLRIGGYNLFKSEASGISYEKLTPKTASTAKRLWGIYVGLTAIQTVLLLLGDMDFFDALCHSFGTIATGGFSTKNTSIALFSPYSQYVILLFMLLSGINFVLHYFFIKGRFKKIWHNDEFKTYLSILLVSGLLVTGVLMAANGGGWEETLRTSFFQVVSIMTSTGFVTDNYLLWPAKAGFIIFLLMFVGASIGSTGGGIKVIRHVVAFKSFYVHFKRLLRPNSIIPLRVNGETIDDDKVSVIVSFIMLYFVTFFAGSLVMLFLGLDTATATSSVLSALGAVGPAFGTVGPVSNFFHIPDVGKILLSFFMVLGRLELITVFILFTRFFWKD